MTTTAMIYFICIAIFGISLIASLHRIELVLKYMHFVQRHHMMEHNVLCEQIKETQQRIKDLEQTFIEHQKRCKIINE